MKRMQTVTSGYPYAIAVMSSQDGVTHVQPMAEGNELSLLLRGTDGREPGPLLGRISISRDQIAAFLVAVIEEARAVEEWREPEEARAVEEWREPDDEDDRA